MEKLEIIINEMMADDGPMPMDLGNVSGYDTKSRQGDSDKNNEMSYEDVCAIAWKGCKAGTGAGQKGPQTSGKREMTEARKEARKAPRAANPIAIATRTKEAKGKESIRAKARAKPDTATTVESRGTSE